MLERMATEIRPVPRAPGFVSVSNGLARRLLRLGPLMGPNALLTVRGRKSGALRTTPVALVDVGGRRWVIGTFGDVNWVRNLREARRATITVGKRSEDVAARELTVEEATAFFRDVLGPYARSLRAGPLLLRVLGAGDILADPAGSARKRPVFELSR
jgi:deazaflavin-dependent oxidoreductase (nitroreductase family)